MKNLYLEANADRGESLESLMRKTKEIDDKVERKNKKIYKIIIYIVTILGIVFFININRWNEIQDIEKLNKSAISHIKKGEWLLNKTFKFNDDLSYTISRGNYWLASDRNGEEIQISECTLIGDAIKIGKKVNINAKVVILIPVEYQERDCYVKVSGNISGWYQGNYDEINFENGYDIEMVYK